MTRELIVHLDESGATLTNENLRWAASLDGYPNTAHGASPDRALAGLTSLIRRDATSLAFDEWFPPNGEPPPIDPPAGERIPRARLLIGIDPLDPTTFGLQRDYGQAWAAGNMFQLLQSSDYIGPRLPLQHREGYGLTMDADGGVRSWQMEDGTHTRYGRVDDEDGRSWWRLASQFRLVDGYNPSTNQFHGGYQINEGIDRAHGHSDGVTFDGTRSGLTAIGADIRVGPGADEIVAGFEIKIEPWMSGRSNCNGPFDLHAYGHRHTGPVVCHIESGQLTIGGKNPPNPVLDQVNDGNPAQSVRLATIDLPPAGSTLPGIIRAVVDRTGGRHRFEFYTVGDDGKAELLVEYLDPYGYHFTDPAKSGQFYPIFQCYNWHQWSSDPPWNWDDTHGNIRRMDFTGPAVAVNRADPIVPAITPDRMASHLIAMRSNS